MPKLLPSGINISRVDLFALNDAVDEPEEWIRSVVRDKVQKSRKGIRAEWLDKLIDDENVLTIPADEDTLLDTISIRPDYKNRRQRDGGLPRNRD